MFHVKQIENKIDIRECPICSNDSFKTYFETKDYFFTNENFTLSQCKNCDFVFTNPIPNNLDYYYETPEYLSHNTKNKSIITKLYSEIRKINLKRKYNLVSKYIDKGSILDIGCGTGELLEQFCKNGWETIGIEPNKNAREIASKKIEVFDEKDLQNLKPKSFDVISMWHVLEHVPHLNKRITEVSNLCKNDGIMIFALPNLNSPDSRKYGKYWSALDVPRHLYHFTQQTFEKLISKHGLKLIHAEPMKFDSYYVSMLSEKYRNNSLYLASALYNGFLSNLKAKKENNYSSMIFVVKNAETK